MHHCKNCGQTFEDEQSFIEHCYISYEDEESRVMVHDTPTENPRLKVVHAIREDYADSSRYGHMRLIGRPFEEPPVWPVIVAIFVLAGAFGLFCGWFGISFWR